MVMHVALPARFVLLKHGLLLKEAPSRHRRLGSKALTFCIVEKVYGPKLKMPLTKFAASF
jgi:hypothetical protein